MAYVCPVLVVLALLYVLYLVYRRAVFTAAFKFPGPRAWPLIGNSSLLLGSRSDFFRLCLSLGRQHPDGIFRLWVGMRPFVFLYNSSVIKPLVTSSIHLEKNFEYSLTEGWLGNGLITSKGNDWLRQRKVLTSCFHFNILREFSSPVWRHARVLLDKLKGMDTSRVDFVPLAKLLALDIICETAMGIDVGTQANSDAEYPTAVSRMTEILAHRFITPWMKSDFIFQLSSNGKEYHKHLSKVQGFVQQIILKKRMEMRNGVQQDKGELKYGGKEWTTDVLSEETECGSFKRDDQQDSELCKDCSRPTCSTPDNERRSPKKNVALLDCLLNISKENPSVTDKDITDQVNTFMFAGHDTISCAISFIFFALGHHPEWQDAIVNELNQECPEMLTSELDSKTILKGLTVMDRCIKEALRLYPPSPMVGRTINSPLSTPGGNLPPGTTAIIYTFLLHRDPAVFKEPDKFDPDRFLPENVSQDSFTYIPFSAGPRNCIGKTLAMLEMKIILALVLKTFRVKSLQTPSELDLCFEIVLTNPQGILLEFTPRD